MDSILDFIDNNYITHICVTYKLCKFDSFGTKSLKYFAVNEKNMIYINSLIVSEIPFILYNDTDGYIYYNNKCIDLHDDDIDHWIYSWWIGEIDRIEPKQIALFNMMINI